MKIRILFCLVILLAGCGSVPAQENMKTRIEKVMGNEIIKRAELAMNLEPVTVTAVRAERSEGGSHDFYSEGDYWWSDPQDPDGPYIRRDGETNPGNFTAHRQAMIRFSRIVGDLMSGYQINKDHKYVDEAMKHIRAWFTDQKTMMNPNLLYAQAIKGIATGRGIGIIDTIHLIEVARALLLMEEQGLIFEQDLKNTKLWFSDYLTWMSTHRYGMDEMNAKNNHGTCWVMQAAAFARYTGNEEMLRFCTERYKTVLLPSQMAENGSFPLELNRTKPYGYSLFNLDAMTTVCQILSTPSDDLWKFTTSDGKNIHQGVNYMFPFVQNKALWPLQPDVMYWDEWPVAHPFLLFSVMNSWNQKYLEVWMKLDHYPETEEVIRNLPVRHPLLWIK